MKTKAELITENDLNNQKSTEYITPKNNMKNKNQLTVDVLNVKVVKETLDKLITENDQFKSEIITLKNKLSNNEKMYQYSKELVKDLDDINIKLQLKYNNSAAEASHYQTMIIELRQELSARKKSWFQRWLGI